MQASATDFKTTVRTHWDAAAAGWDQHTPALHAWLCQATEAMIAMAGVQPGARVLDVAAGAGDQTLALAERVGPAGAVVAVDLSPALVALGEQRARRAGLAQVRWCVGDGEALPADASSFDAAVCRLGLMLFPDPLQGLRELHRVLRPGGRICTVVFAGPPRNPCITALTATALRHAGLPARDPFAPGSLFSLSRPGQLDRLCQEAGFCDVATTAMDAVFHMPGVDDYLAFVRSSASPVLQMLAGLDATAAQAAWDDIRQQLQAFSTATGWAGPNELLLTAARKPGSAA